MKTKADVVKALDLPRLHLPLLIRIKDRPKLSYIVTILLWCLIIAVILLIICGIVLLLSWPVILAGFWRDVRGAASSLWGRALITLALAAFGVLLYVIRTYQQSLYGAAEIVVGMTACWAGLSNSSASDLSASLAIASGVYIIVRGLDNVKQGRAKKQANVQNGKPNKSLNRTRNKRASHPSR